MTTYREYLPEGGGVMGKLTQAQWLALRHLESVNWCTPASLGYAMTPKGKRQSGYPLAAQGAGRIGGAMGSRLVKKGLAERQMMPWNHSKTYAAGYKINDDGRAALAAARRGRGSDLPTDRT